MGHAAFPIAIQSPRQGNSESSCRGCLKKEKIMDSDNEKVAAIAKNVLPRGTVIAWYGTGAVTIPDPTVWAVCDGTNGTPDLRGKFVSGVSDLASVGLDPSGTSSHSHPGSTALPVVDPAFLIKSTDKFDDSLPTTYDVHTHPLAITEASHIPPNFRLIYLMKR
jgi:hypothetical protein